MLTRRMPRARSVDRAGAFVRKSAQRGVDDIEILLEHGTQVFDADPASGVHPAFMQETLTMFAHFPQRLAVLESYVARNDIFNGLGHNHPPTLTKRPPQLNQRCRWSARLIHGPGRAGLTIRCRCRMPRGTA